MKVMLATSGAISAARLSREIVALPGMVLVGNAPGLSQAYMMAEAGEPDIALISAEFCRQPEFEGLLSLFRVMGTSWIEIEVDHRNRPEGISRGLPARSATAFSQHGNDPAPVPTGAGNASAGGAVAASHQDRIRTGMAPAEMLALLRRRRSQRIIPLRNQPLTPDPMAGPPGTDTNQFDPTKLILIGASTGGIDALLTILSRFPADCPPTAIVQHTGPAFSDSLIRLFARCSAARVVPAGPDILLTAGTIVVGAGCPGHLQIAPRRPLRTELGRGPPISGHVPSVDGLFRSAIPVAEQVVAALLTGMGRDGAQGLLELRRAGATTIVQDEATAVVYGMPKAAMELGAAEMSLPLDRIAGELLSRCRARPPTAVAHFSR